MEPHSIVVLSLHSPKERLWGELVEISNAGVTMRGIDLGSFDDFVIQVLHPEGRPHRIADAVFPHGADRADRAGRGARLDSVDGRDVREEGGPLDSGLPRAVRLMKRCL